MLELRWLLELRMQRYKLAAGTLARVARAQGGDANAFAAAKRAACLGKVALLADQEGGLAPMRPKVRVPTLPLDLPGPANPSFAVRDTVHGPQAESCLPGKPILVCKADVFSQLGQKGLPGERACISDAGKGGHCGSRGQHGRARCSKPAGPFGPGAPCAPVTGRSRAAGRLKDPLLPSKTPHGSTMPD